MTVETLRFLIDRANRMDDATPKKVRRHTVGLLAEAARDMAEPEVTVSAYAGPNYWSLDAWGKYDECDDSAPKIELSNRLTPETKTESCIPSAAPDAVEVLVEALEWLALGNRPTVQEVRHRLAEQQYAGPVRAAGGILLPADTRIMAVWPNGATARVVEMPSDATADKVGIFNLGGSQVFVLMDRRGAETLATATGARVFSTVEDPYVLAVWRDGRFLRRTSTGWRMSWADGFEADHDSLSVALADQRTPLDAPDPVAVHATPLSVVRQIEQAGACALVGDAQVLAVWPDGSFGVEGKFCYARKVDVAGQLIERYERPSEFWTPAKATGARAITCGDAVRGVWPDGKALIERSDGWLASWPDGRDRLHDDLSVALDCDGECEQ